MLRKIIRIESGFVISSSSLLLLLFNCFMGLQLNPYTKQCLSHTFCQDQKCRTRLVKPTVDSTTEVFSFLMATNFESTLHLSQQAHPLLKASGVGSIVFISSLAGISIVPDEKSPRGGGE